MPSKEAEAVASGDEGSPRIGNSRLGWIYRRTKVYWSESNYHCNSKRNGQRVIGSWAFHKLRNEGRSTPIFYAQNSAKHCGYFAPAKYWCYWV